MVWRNDLAAPCAQQFTYSLPQPLHALLGNPQTTVALRGDAEPQELPFPGPRHRALLCVDSQAQGILEEHPDPAHHPLTRRATAQINVAVISVAAERESSSLKLPVQIVQQDVGQQRRQRPALRRAFRSRLHHSRSHHSGFQEPADQLQHSCIADSPRHPRHQHIVIDPIEELLQIDVHHPALTLADVRLRSAHRLMCPSPRTKAVAAHPRTSVQIAVAEPDAAPAGSADPPPSALRVSAPRLSAWVCPLFVPAAVYIGLPTALSSRSASAPASQSLSSDTGISSIPAAPLFSTTR